MPTFRRPDCLRRLLPALVAQSAAVPGSCVLVVDNDPDGGARAQVLAVAATAGTDVRYVHEPKPGIAAARNRALDEAAGAAALVFVDDDEQPGPHWLHRITERWRQTGASAVTGPVEPVYPAGRDAVDPWVLASLRFARRDLPDGALLRSAATNNLLLDLATVSRLGLRFDDSFGLTGGEDTAFTHELVARGGVIVWCADAVVHDHLPADRLTRRWVLRREFRSGTSWARMRLAHAPRSALRPLLRIDLAARGSLRMLAALARVGVGVVTRDVRHRARGAGVAAANAGLVLGAFGYRYGEYRRPR